MSANLSSEMILLFGLIAVGYITNKAGILDKTADNRFSAFILKIALPSTIVSSVIGQHETERSEILFVVFIAVGIYIVMPFISWLIASAFHWSSTYQLMLNYSNLGFMGFPIIRGLYGEENLFYAAIFMMVFNFHVFTVGVMTLQGVGKHSAEWQNHMHKDTMGDGLRGRKISFIWKMIFNPGILSSLLAFVIVMFRISVPEPVADILSSLGGTTTPLALVVIGSQLAQVDMIKCLSRLDLYLMSLFKLMVYPSLVYLILTAITGSGIVTNIATILIGLPVAGNVTMLCSEYGGDTSLAAQGTGVSILLSLVTIPVMLSVL